MSIYLSLLFLVILLLLSRKSKKLRWYDLLLLTAMILISGLRYGIGTDYLMYKSFYFDINLPNAAKVEIGFKVLILIANFLFKEKYWLFFTLCSCISIVPIYLLFKKKSNNPALSFLIFISLGFYTLSFNMVRQFIALSFCMIAIPEIEHKNLIKYSFLILVASFFHITSLIMLPMYLWGNKVGSKKTMTRLFFLEMFAGFLFNPIFNFAVSNIPQYSMYSNYGGVNAGIGTYLLSFVYLIIILFQISHYDFFANNKFNKICLNISVLAVPFIVFSTFNILFARLIYYFLIPALIPLANITNFFKEKKTQKIFNILIICVCIAFFILNILSFNGVYPYRSIIDYNVL